jgi:Spy/CpxP family protein refolding chaperone
MKKKWIVLAGVVLALGALVATAAAHRGGKMRGHGPRALMEQLDLSDEQQEQLVELRSEHREQMKEARGDGAEAFKALREEHRAAVSKILNEVQREKMEALQLKGLHKAHREVVEQLKGLLLPIPLRFQAPTYRGQNQWRIAIRMPE